MTGNLISEIKNGAQDRIDPAGRPYRSIDLKTVNSLAHMNQCSPRQVEIAALEYNIIPERYQRSIGILGVEGQLKLRRSKAGVLGAGGLGGFAVELLARMGIGKLIIIDDDIFSESNLNRQLYSSENNLGLSKAKAASERINVINSAVEVSSHQCRGDLESLPELLKGCDVVLDCLDNLPSRYDLEKVCGSLKITMIHGAIAGFLGQIAVIRPDRPLLSSIYGPSDKAKADKGIEVELGNPAFTPAMLASWQVGEAVKILAGLGNVLPADKMLMFDMQSGESYQVGLSAR